MHRLFKWSAKWWPGVIPLVVFWGLAAWFSTAPLEADLAARSTKALKGAVLDKTGVEVDGRDVTLSADAFSEQGRRNAIASVEVVPGVRPGRHRRTGVRQQPGRSFAGSGKQSQSAQPGGMHPVLMLSVDPPRAAAGMVQIGSLSFALNISAAMLALGAILSAFQRKLDVK